jgi:hypothetical protein
MRTDGSTGSRHLACGVCASRASRYPDRLAILRVLDEPPAGPLARLRGLLLAEHVGRVRGGLA